MLSSVRICSYNLGFNITDKKSAAKLPALLRRLEGAAVDIVCFQEVRPYLEQGYARHEKVEEALEEASSYDFFFGGNCATGCRDLVAGKVLRSFPQARCEKYGWRSFCKTTCQIHGLRVVVLNAHTRANSGKKSHDTSDEYRKAFVQRLRQEILQEISVGLVDLAVVVGDFNMLRPWGPAAAANLEAALEIPGVPALWAHSVPDHVAVFALKPSVRLLGLGETLHIRCGKGEDGVGDHPGLLRDLSLQVVAGEAPPPPPPARPLSQRLPPPPPPASPQHQSVQHAETWEEEEAAEAEEGWAYAMTSDGKVWWHNLLTGERVVPWCDTGLWRRYRFEHGCWWSLGNNRRWFIERACPEVSYNNS